AAAGLPPALKKILDQETVQFATTSPAYFKRTYDRTEAAFETRYIAVTATGEPAPSPTTAPVYGALKIVAHQEPPAATAWKPQSPAAAIPADHTPAPPMPEVPAGHPDQHPDQHPAEALNQPPVRSPAEEKSEKPGV